MQFSTINVSYAVLWRNCLIQSSCWFVLVQSSLTLTLNLKSWQRREKQNTKKSTTFQRSLPPTEQFPCLSQRYVLIFLHCIRQQYRRQTMEAMSRKQTNSALQFPKLRKYSSPFRKILGETAPQGARLGLGRRSPLGIIGKFSSLILSVFHNSTPFEQKSAL